MTTLGNRGGRERRGNYGLLERAEPRGGKERRSSGRMGESDGTARVLRKESQVEQCNRGRGGTGE